MGMALFATKFKVFTTCQPPGGLSRRLCDDLLGGVEANTEEQSQQHDLPIT